MNERSVLGIVCIKTLASTSACMCIGMCGGGGGGGEVIVVPNIHNTNNMAPQNISVPSLHIGGAL